MSHGNSSYVSVDVELERAEARREATRTMRMNRRQPDHDWMTSEAAAAVLCVARGMLYQHRVHDTIQCRSRSRRSDNAQGTGRLWWRRDVEAIAKIKRECGLGLSGALRVFAAQREGRI